MHKGEKRKRRERGKENRKEKGKDIAEVPNNPGYTSPLNDPPHLTLVFGEKRAPPHPSIWSQT